MKKTIILVLTFSYLLLVTSCNNNKLSKMSNNNIEATNFAQKLINREFGDFFIYPMHNQTIDVIWKDTSNRILIENVLIDSTIAVEAKFLACEILFKKDIFFMQRHTAEKVAKIYTQSLINNYTGLANSWGLLYEKNDDGATGIAFLTIGKKAIPALSKLLDDERTNLEYQGSIEATIGNNYKYRIKDFAAYYIGRIMGNPLKYYSTYEERDIQIKKLKETIEEMENK